MTNNAGDILGLTDYKDTAFPDAVELCVKEDESIVTLWISSHLTTNLREFADFDDKSFIIPSKYFEGGEEDEDRGLNWRAQTPSFAIMDEDGCFATPYLRQERLADENVDRFDVSQRYEYACLPYENSFKVTVEQRELLASYLSCPYRCESFWDMVKYTDNDDAWVDADGSQLKAAGEEECISKSSGCHFEVSNSLTEQNCGPAGNETCGTCWSNVGNDKCPEYDEIMALIDGDYTNGYDNPNPTMQYVNCEALCSGAHTEADCLNLSSGCHFDSDSGTCSSTVAGVGMAPSPCPEYRVNEQLVAPPVFDVCPQRGVFSTHPFIMMRFRNASDGERCAGLHDLGDSTKGALAPKVLVPEIALMEAIESGFSIPQFSTYISAFPEESSGCPVGEKEIHIVVESPNGGMDAFSYGIRSITDDNRVTVVRHSGGTLLSPERYLVDADGATRKAKLPQRIGGGIQREPVMFFDCQPEMRSDGLAGVETAEFSPDDVRAVASPVWEVAQKRMADVTKFSDLPESERGSCFYSTEDSIFKTSRMCAKPGEYTLQASKASSNVRVEGTKVYVTDAIGCNLAQVDVPSISASATIPSTVKVNFTITIGDGLSGSEHAIDPLTGVLTCASPAYSVSHSVKMSSSTSTSKPVCETGYRLVEMVTQTSWEGDKNFWMVHHVTFNDTAIDEAGIGGEGTASDFADHLLFSTRTDMHFSTATADTLSVDQWCMRPGNYSITLFDRYAASNLAETGWRGGSVFASGFDECEIFQTSPRGNSAATTYFVIRPGEDQPLGMNPPCAYWGLTRRNISSGWCTYNLDTATDMCAEVDSRSEITKSTTAQQIRCMEGVCRNPRCHEDMLLHRTRFNGDLELGCCEHIAGTEPFPLDTFAVPVSSESAPDPVPEDTSWRRRLISGKNVIIGGVLLEQTRSGVEQCKGKFGAERANYSLSGEVCPASETRSLEPYGVDPAFITSSTLYNSVALVFMCCKEETHSTNTSSSGSFFYTQNELNVRGTPYGFFPVNMGARGINFPVVIDVNIDENAFNKLMAYLEDGFYIDKYTQSIKLQMLTYNGELRYLCSLVIDLDFSQGGNILVKYSTDPTAANPYYFDQNKKSEISAHVFRRIFEVIFIIWCSYAMLVEIIELVKAWRKHGHPGEYFSSIWNYIELLSISLHFSSIFMWSLIVLRLSELDVSLRYDVYSDANHGQIARILELKDGGAHLDKFAVKVLQNFSSIVELRVMYGTLNGVNIFLCLLRFFKAADFQPKLGIVTRTIGMAFQELLHFFMLLGVVCGMYTLLGQVVFGSKVYGFSTTTQAAQTIISWTLSGDDRGVGEELFDLPGNLSVAGSIFYMTFAFLTTLMLLNFLIAILSDGYMRVQEESAGSSPFFSEFATLIARSIRAKMSKGKLLTDERALTRVRAMVKAQAKDLHSFQRKYGLDGKPQLSKDHMDKSKNDSDSDNDEVGSEPSRFSIAGAEGEHHEPESLRRILQNADRCTQQAVMTGSKSAQRGVGDVDVLLNSIIGSVVEKVESEEHAQGENQLAELHSMVSLLCKQVSQHGLILKELQQHALRR